MMPPTKMTSAGMPSSAATSANELCAARGGPARRPRHRPLGAVRRLQPGGRRADAPLPRALPGPGPHQPQHGQGHGRCARAGAPRARGGLLRPRRANRCASGRHLGAPPGPPCTHSSAAVNSWWVTWVSSGVAQPAKVGVLLQTPRRDEPLRLLRSFRMREKCPSHRCAVSGLRRSQSHFPGHQDGKTARDAAHLFRECRY